MLSRRPIRVITISRCACSSSKRRRQRLFRRTRQMMSWSASGAEPGKRGPLCSWRMAVLTRRCGIGLSARICSCASSVRTTLEFQSSRSSSCHSRNHCAASGSRSSSRRRNSTSSRGVARGVGTDAFSQPGKAFVELVEEARVLGIHLVELVVEVALVAPVRGGGDSRGGEAGVFGVFGFGAVFHRAAILDVRRIAEFQRDFDAALAVELAALFPGQLGFRDHATLRSCSCPPILARSSGACTCWR